MLTRDVTSETEIDSTTRFWDFFVDIFYRLCDNKPQWEDLNGPRSYDSTPNLFTYGFGRGKLPCRFYNVHPTLIG